MGRLIEGLRILISWSACVEVRNIFQYILNEVCSTKFESDFAQFYFEVFEVFEIFRFFHPFQLNVQWSVFMLARFQRGRQENRNLPQAHSSYSTHKYWKINKTY